jgi:baculoviral IAP repeat-containing protein 6
VIAATKAQSGYSDGKSGSGSGSKSDDKSHVYWAKGTGFGTGSTAQSWDVEMAIEKKKNEEENVTCLLHLMSSYINPKISRSVASKLEAAESTQPRGQSIPEEVTSLLRSSCLFNAIAGYLRNDSGELILISFRKLDWIYNNNIY